MALFGITDTACSQPDSGVLNAVEKMENECNLAIIEGGSAIFTINQTLRGRIALPVGISGVEVSPDAMSVAWCPHATSYQYPSMDREIKWSDGINPIRSTRLSGTPSVFALSSRPTSIALVLNANSTRRLIVISTESNRETDISSLVPQDNLVHAQRLRQSSDGDRLVVGSEQRFMVIDVARKRALLELEGQMPSISPNGREVAFVRGHDLLVVDLNDDSRQEKRIDTGMWIEFAGGWSPDGRFLLAGGRRQMSMTDYRLIAVELASGRFAEIRRSPDEITSQMSWISRGFLLN